MRALEESQLWPFLTRDLRVVIIRMQGGRRGGGEGATEAGGLLVLLCFENVFVSRSIIN